MLTKLKRFDTINIKPPLDTINHFNIPGVSRNKRFIFELGPIMRELFCSLITSICLDLIDER